MLSTIFISIIGGLILGLLLAWGLHFFQRKKTVPLSSGESNFLKEAEQTLKKNGFTILEHGPRATLLTLVDGRNYFGDVTVDFLAQKGKKTYAVKIQDSPVFDFSEPGFRRQLLECSQAFRKHRLLAFDPQSRELHEVIFHSPRQSLQEKFFQLLAVTFIIALIIAILWFMITLRLY